MSNEKENFSLFTSQDPEAVAWRIQQIVASNAIEGIERNLDNVVWDEALEKAGIPIEERIERFIRRIKAKAKTQSAA